jgi:uncharacterized protein with PQ loop repeat
MCIDYVGLLGVVATVVSTSVLIPSVVSQIRCKCPGKTHITVLVQVMLANLLWILYSALRGDIYVLGRSLVAGAVSAISIYLYYRYRR